MTTRGRSKTVSAAIIAVFVTAGVITTSLILKSIYIYQEPSEGISEVLIDIQDLQSAELLIEQGEDSEQAYSIAIDTPVPTTSWGVLDRQVHPLTNESGDLVVLYFYFQMNVSKMTITLSTEMRYRISVGSSHDLNTTVYTTSDTYMTRFGYSATGNLTLFLDECNAKANETIQIAGGFAPRPDYVGLYIDLPSGFDGYIYLPSGLISVLHNTGWSFDGDDTFTSGTGEPPGIYVQLEATVGFLLWLQ